ncbi:MAG TPA: UTP--glucose-1-phosphate uridylyltransferase, partial [Rhabdochlamydiaceae bacterium]|nr:UTP--glucose-1-phosphate uridylyltransferase [Rhabdochlamydiaceae bacterium]
MKEKLFEGKESIQEFEPLRTFDFAGNQDDIEIGERLIAEGKVGCLILAGGQGSRLNLSIPKALINVSFAKAKSLLQLFCEKTKAASKKAQCSLKIALMTSPLNEEEIHEYLKKNHYFGLSEEQVFLFSQGMLPFLDPSGNPILQPSGEYAQGPDGNGGTLKAFFHSGIWDKWRQDGIEYLNLVLIDNPLADPFDSNLVGYHTQRDLEITLKTVLREREDEKVGIIVQHRNKVRVIEYSDFPEEMKYEKSAGGSFVWKLANISLF